MKKRLVVAKYNEDTKWLEEYKKIDDLDILVYNKMNDLSDYSSFTLKDENNIDLFNIGREAHTYIWHIVNNYNNLKDVEIFTQGRIDDTIDTNHFWEFLNSLNRENFNGFFEFSPCVKYIAFDKSYFEKLKILYPDSIHVGYWSIGEKEFYNKIYEKNPVNLYYTTRAHAIFAVSKELILRHPKTKYLKLLNSCDPNKEKEEDIISFPYKMEHFWNLLFTHPLD